MNLGAVMIIIGFWGGLLVYPVLQFVAVKRMHGGWRFLALLPVALMAYLFVVTAIAYQQDSNLWPIALILVSPLVLVYLVVLLVSHHFMVRRKNE